MRVATTRSAPRSSPIGSTPSPPPPDDTPTPPPAVRGVLLDEGGRLVVDDRVDQVVQRLGDDLLDLLDVPAAAECGEVLAHPLHLVVVGAPGEEDELRIGGPQGGPAVDQSALVEGLAEGERARLRNDRLVQVKEGCCAGQG